MKILLLGIWGLSIGIFISCGVCALLTAVGIVTRIARKTKTQKKIRMYENSIFIGTVGANIIYIYHLNLYTGEMFSKFLLGLIGLMFGIFVGCLAMSLAEALDASTILFKRVKVKKYIRFVILTAAIGKFLGNIIYFVKK